MHELGNNLNVICLESSAFHQLVEQVVQRLSTEITHTGSKWIDDSEAMTLLHISSKSTLQKYRDEGSIRFSQPSRKVILYDRNSILAFLEANAKDTF